MQLSLEKLVKIWNGWEVRLLVLVSLILQVILIIFGARRKFTSSMMVSMLVWSAYLVADSVATLALGNLASSQVDSKHSERKFSEPNSVLQSFWAPFLLLHLGGPDTITAYSLEDNELWLRHLLGLVLQVGVAIYVFLRSWSYSTALTFLAIPVFISGVIKYGERTFVLRSSSMHHFRDSLQSSPVSDQVKELIDPNAHDLVQASFLFQRSKQLFANFILDYYGQEDPSYSTIHDKSAEDAFKLVEAELGFMYDVLFTKATIVYSRIGILLRCTTFFSSVSALVVFSIIIDINSYPLADISLTYLLLVAAVFLEIYAFVLFLLSDWTKIWLIKLNTAQLTPIWKTLLHIFFDVTKPIKRRSRSMAQYNLVNSCLKYKSATFIGNLISKLVDLISKLVDIRKYKYLSWKSVDIDFQNMIFKMIQDISAEVLNNFMIDECQSLKQLLSRRGDYVLKNKYSLDEYRWSTIEVDFDHSILGWHIATDICYYLDHGENQEDDKHKTESKALSDYMLYLLVFCPSMINKGISHEIRYRDTCNEIKSGLKFRRQKSYRERLLEYAEEFHYKEGNNMSVLHLGCRLARKLQELESRLDWGKQRKWKMISEVWTEMLVYAAIHCAWKDHGQQLGKGGELLTHVSLVMAHLGLSEQYQMKQLRNDLHVPDREWSDLF